jgi:hypothetical protein
MFFGKSGIKKSFLLFEYKIPFNKMYKAFLFVAIYLVSGIGAFCADGDSSLSGFNVSEYQAEVRKIKIDADEIYKKFEIFDLEIVEEEYQKLSNDVTKVEQILKDLNASSDINVRNEFFDLFEETRRSYGTLVNLYDFYMQLERKKDRWSNEYFNLWEQTYAYKIRIDQLYVKEEKVNVHYGGMKDTKVTKIRKKNIYAACESVYNKKLDQLKRLNDCDHHGRILILEELIPVLRKCSKLVLIDGTKPLEKDLKNTEDPEVKAELILDFQVD